MSTIKIATRYAKALLEESIERKVLEDIHSDMTSIRNAISESRDLELFLKSPIISSDKKLEIIRKIFSGKVNPLMLSFLEILVDKKREGLMEDVAVAFESAYNQLKGITKVKLTTAVTLSAQLEDQIIEKIKTQFNLENIDVTMTVDPHIIGGFIIQFDDKVYDNSVAHRINSVERSIIS